MDQKEVLSWIRKAKDENWDGLDLSRNNIATLPPEIGELKNLSVLDISETSLTAFPSEPRDYEYLLMLEREGQGTLLVKDVNRLVKIDVRQILSGIESESKRKETTGNITNIYVGGDVSGNLIAGNENNLN